MPWRAFGGSDADTERAAEIAVSVSMPWRAFGGSDARIAIGVEPDQRFQCPGGRSGVRTHDQTNIEPWEYMVSMPWRAFGGSDIARAILAVQAEMSFNALAGVRGFGLDHIAPIGCNGCDRFQCPGGRSGVRTYYADFFGVADHGFNALAGVRGFGQIRCFAGTLEVAEIVSMPWRAFGGSDRRRQLRAGLPSAGRFYA